LGITRGGIPTHQTVGGVPTWSSIRIRLELTPALACVPAGHAASAAEVKS
jgi:hypothetical protein